MADAITVSGAIGAEDKIMKLETGVLASLANGAVVVSVGKTTVLVTATANKSAKPGTDFFPLTVDFEERSYAAGKIPGSFSDVKEEQANQQFLHADLQIARCVHFSQMDSATMFTSLQQY